MNFLQETIAELKESGYRKSDIILIADINGATCTWEEFKPLADFDYDNGFGFHTILDKLRIYLKDHSVLIRNEYEKHEWWTHIKTELPKPTGKKITILKNSD